MSHLSPAGRGEFPWWFLTRMPVGGNRKDTVKGTERTEWAVGWRREQEARDLGTGSRTEFFKARGGHSLIPMQTGKGILPIIYGDLKYVVLILKGNQFREYTPAGYLTSLGERMAPEPFRIQRCLCVRSSVTIIQDEQPPRKLSNEKRSLPS
ncbi:uncharacterized protein EI90DRAFT_3014139 [Cantharellus anzutake]|uniref:uncharacterized protein n=1 Tax=Cantharellus anzutake TaxID=1750568 RepID=UPI0019089BA7|nr:uncharacterized protein EI90DRAFT_3014139 [Cantharellus anzutake]KAF8336358.1 hypothetical protein EI90DRAFT_3014139 [Cantharellus anzutake]